MSPINISDITKLEPVKKRKKGIRRESKASDYGIGEFKYATYSTGKGGKSSRQGRRFECRWCSRTYKPDGRPVMSCNWHLDSAIIELQRRGKNVPQELWDLVEKIWMYRYELWKKKQT